MNGLIPYYNFSHRHYSVLKIRWGTFFLVFFMIIMANFKSGMAQTRVTGHVFAEIVEPTALTATATNNHVIYANNNTASNDLVLAEVTLSGGPNVDIGVSVFATTLDGENGETYSLNAFACPGCSQDEQKANINEKVFKLMGTPDKDIFSERSNLFTAQYQVVFMYN